MRKYPIKWHQECFKNQDDYVKNLEAELDRRFSILIRAKKERDEYKAQIEQAIKEGRDAFDPDRYKVKG